MRIPDGSTAVSSPGMVLRLTTMPAISRMRAAISPDNPVPSSPFTVPQSRFIRCVFVPPKGMRKPRSLNCSHIAVLFFSTCFCRSRNCLLFASLKATAIAAKTFTCGPPCSPGKTARSISRDSLSSVVRMQAPRGPHSDLCVVNVITSAYPTGEGYTPAATIPATCAISANR